MRWSNHGIPEATDPRRRFHASARLGAAPSPGAAAGSVRDRHSGRLAELQLTGLSSFQICLAKSMAAALWFLIPALGILVLFSGVLLLDATPAGEVARLSLECAGAVLLTAMVTV